MISVIFPVFNEEENLEALHKRLESVVLKISNQRFEFIFVDDCSTDKTPEILKTLNRKDPRVKTIRFARNCGSHAALRAGLNYCQGECAIILAADLQDPPELIPRLMEEWRNGYKLVWGVRAKREGEKPSTKFFSRMYYAIMNWLTTVNMPSSGADVFLADRAVINAFKQITEKHTSVFMALAWLGFSQTAIGYVKQARHRGIPKWTLGKKFKLTIDSLLSFSDVPIRYMSVLGFLVALAGFTYAIYIVWQYFCHSNPVEGWKWLMVSIFVIGGIQMMMLGVLGEYLWRTFDESRKRPQFIVDYIIGGEEKN